MLSGSSLHGFCPNTKKAGPQAEDSLRGRWWQGPSVPFLRDMEVTTHPHVLVRGIRRVGLAGGRDTCCSGRQRSDTYTPTRTLSPTASPPHSSRSLWGGREATLTLTEALANAQHRKLVTFISGGGGACTYLLRSPGS